MKTIRLYKTKFSLFFSALVLSLSFNSCTINELSEDVSNTEFENAKNYSSEDLFRAIFFLEGELVNQIPSLKNIRIQSEILSENAVIVTNKTSNGLSIENQEKKIEDFRNSIVDNVSEMNPSIFDELKTAIISKNPDMVTQEIKESALLIKAALFNTVDGFEEGISILEEAYNTGIDPKNHDFSNTSEIEKYNSDIEEFINSNSDISKMIDDNASLALAVVLIVVAVVYLAVAVLAAVAVVGEVAVAAFNVLWIHNWFWVAEPQVLNPELNEDSLGINLVIKDLIEL